MDINWQKLSWLASAPRTWDESHAPLYEKIKAKPFWFVFWGGGIAGWRREMCEGFLVRLGVIQANEALFDSEEAEFAPAVVCWFTDPADNASDAAMLALLDEIQAARSSSTPRPDCQPFFDLLDKESSSFSNIQIPVSLTGGKQAFASVIYLEPDELPGGCIPANRILPAFKGKETPELIARELYA
ncbi:MAG: hypothetical protein JW940_08110 [Polyangiaceae bacterium]|nr:hypothetical protein [Polyangiaceae bacterium]